MEREEFQTPMSLSLTGTPSTLLTGGAQTTPNRMHKYRKELMSSKVDGLLKKRELALFFHYSNVNAKDWQRIRAELALAGEIPLLVVKNRVAKRRILSSLPPSIQQPLASLDLGEKRDCFYHFSLKPASSAVPRKETQFDDEKVRVSHPKGEQIDSRRMRNEKVAASDLLQGPTLLVGCNSLKDSKLVFSILSKSGHFLLVGGIYNRKSINYIPFLCKNPLPQSHSKETEIIF